MTRTSRWALLSLAAIAAVSSARTARAEERARPGPLAVGAKLGVVLPQVATELETAFGGELEASFGRRIAGFASFGYTQPRVTRTSLMDPRLPGVYDGEQTQRELTFGAGVLARAKPAGATWNGYAALAARAYFLETVTVGDSGGAAFGENREQSTRLGGVLTLGGERLLWKGALLLELQFGTSDLPHLITGDVSTGALVGAVGYRLFL